MELTQLIQRAIGVREKYKKLETRKYGRAWTNTEIAQGFVTDIGDLMRLLMAKEGIRRIDDIDKKTNQQFADCLWSIFILANNHGIDLEKSFLETMNNLDKEISEKLKENE